MKKFKAFYTVQMGCLEEAYWGVIEAPTEREALLEIERVAYDEYDDLCGNTTVEMYMVDEGLSEDDAQAAYDEERMTECSYHVEEILE